MFILGPTYKDNGLDATQGSLADRESTIDWSNGIQLSIRRALSSSVSYFVVCCFYHKIFNTTKFLIHVAPFVELMMQKLAIRYK